MMGCREKFSIKLKSRMRNKCAVVIVYEGTPIQGEDHRRIAEAFMRETNCVINGETMDVIGLDSNDIASGILAKAIAGTHFYSDNAPVEHQLDMAARIIGERFAQPIADGPATLAANVSAVYVSIKMRGYSMLSAQEASLVNSIELLSEDNAFSAISPSVRKKYHITKTVIETIKYIHDNICRGRIVTLG